MTAETRAREKLILDRADKIENLVISFVDDLRLHVDLLRAEIEQQEGQPDERS